MSSFAATESPRPGNALMNSMSVRYVFVCGLHRSGTTPLAEKIGKLKSCAGFKNTGVKKDEGQYLQKVYPPDVIYGGVGRFGFAPEMHMTEDSPLLTPANVSALRQSWEAHWEKGKTIRVEKTPANLLKTRFLQAAFPNAHFVVIKRHPVPVSLATQKWSRSPLHCLFEHWLRCHEIFDEDKKHLEHVYELSYEDYVSNPERQLGEIANFIGTEFCGSLEEKGADIYNNQYFQRWERMLRTSSLKYYYRHVATKYQRSFERFGYSLAPSSSAIPFPLYGDKLIRRAINPLLYRGAELLCVPWLLDLRLREWVGQIKEDYCPTRVRAVGRSLKLKVRARRQTAP